MRTKLSPKDVLYNYVTAHVLADVAAITKICNDTGQMPHMRAGLISSAYAPLRALQALLPEESK